MLFKAIKHFESLQKRYTTQHNGKQCEYVRVALEAMRKMTATKPIGNVPHLGQCPTCKSDINGSENNWYPDHCEYCGQALDWSGN